MLVILVVLRIKRLLIQMENTVDVLTILSCRLEKESEIRRGGTDKKKHGSPTLVEFLFRVLFGIGVLFRVSTS